MEFNGRKTEIEEGIKVQSKSFQVHCIIIETAIFCGNLFKTIFIRKFSYKLYKFSFHYVVNKETFIIHFIVI